MNRDIALPAAIGAALLAAAGLVGIAVAGGFGADSPEPTPTPVTDGPGVDLPADEPRGSSPLEADAPRATLSSGGRSVTVDPGTRCWGGAGVMTCIDMAGPISNAEPLIIERGEPFEVSFEAGTPGETRVGWIPVDGVTPATGEGGIATWEGGSPGDMEGRAPGASSVDLEPGRYLDTIFAVYPGQGDLSYAFYLEVR